MMGLMNPLYFLLSIFIAAVILFYLFRKQYERHVVSSNLFWEQVMNEWQASPWINKLQRNILLLLQLIILMSIMLALVNPYWMKKNVRGDHFIFVVDTSASMSATNEGKTRLQYAKQEMNSMVKQLNGQDVTIISSGNQPIINLKNETNQSIISSRINKLSLSYQSSNIEKAIQLAKSMAHSSNTTVHVFSDSVKKEDIPIQTKSLPIQVHNIGVMGSNISLQSFGVADKNGKMAGIATIENQSNQKQKIQFTVRYEDERIFHKDFTIQAHFQKIIQIPSLPKKDYYMASIIVHDSYQADNERTAVFAPSFSKIYAVGNVNPFIIKGFETVGVQVIQLSNKNWRKEATDGVILTDKMPVEKWDTTLPMFAVNPNQNNHYQLQNRIETKNDPLLQYVDFEKTYVKSASKISSSFMKTIADSGGIPLLEKGEKNGARVITVNFSIEDSDWPLQPGFPIFLYQSFHWLSEQRVFQGFFQPGEKKWINTGADSISWKVFDNKGEFIRSFNLQKESFAAPNKPGLYQILSNKETKYFTVILDDSEQNIAVSPSFSMNQSKLRHSNIKVSHSFSNTWYWFALVAFVVLLIEWEVYRRGIRN